MSISGHPELHLVVNRLEASYSFLMASYDSSYLLDELAPPIEIYDKSATMPKMKNIKEIFTFFWCWSVESLVLIFFRSDLVPTRRILALG